MHSTGQAGYAIEYQLFPKQVMYHTAVPESMQSYRSSRFFPF